MIQSDFFRPKHTFQDKRDTRFLFQQNYGFYITNTGEILPMNEMFKEYPDVVSVGQLKEMLQIGQVLAYKLVKEGEIKSRKVGREYKILKSTVIEYLSRGCSQWN